METRTSGSEGGLGKPTGGNPDTASQSDPYTHVAAREGTVYVSFLQDGFSRRILGFRVATSKSAELVTRALEQAVNVRRRSDPWFTTEGVIVHSDAGSQFTSLAFSQKLLDHGISGSIGRVGTAYDCQTVPHRARLGSEVLAVVA